MKPAANYPINRRILVIDDNQDIHADFRKTLAAPVRRDAALEAAEAELFGEPGAAPVTGLRAAADFALDDAFQGQEGLHLVVKACAEGRPYAVAFVDMRMPPGWDGLETIAHLWTADPNLQIVICTAYSDYSWQEIFDRVGASDRLLIVKKPFDAVEIVQLAHALTEKWSLAREVESQVDRLEGAVRERTHDLSVTNHSLMEAIHQQQRSVEALSRSEARFRSIIDTAHAAIVIIDAYGRIELWNPGAERTFGWTAAEATGQMLTMIIPELLADDMRARLERLIASGEAVAESQAVCVGGRHRDGRDFPLEISLAAWRSDSGRSFSCIMQDVSLRRQAEAEILSAKEAAESAARAKSAFLATMSHEIRTPMSGIIGMADLLLSTPLDEQQRDYAGTVKSCATGLLGLINDILDFSKIEAGHLVIENIDFEVRTVIEDAMALFAQQAQLRRIELVSMVDAAVPVMVAGDPTRLRQVLVNLLGNAIKFTHQGEVVLRMLVEGGEGGQVRLRCEISDTGIGISTEAQARLFQSFSQGEASTSRRYGGTGLGLAICRRLVELMGGAIGVRSRPGEGSTFHFTLMVQARTQPEPVVDADLVGLRVLCVDDNPNTRSAVQQALAGWRMYCDTAPGGQRALDMLHAAQASGQPYGLLLLDLYMPEMDGLAVARRVNADPVLVGIPMLLLTDLAHRGQGAEVREAGIAGYLAKPVRGTQLLATIRLVVAQGRSAPTALVTRHTLVEQQRLARPRVLVADDEFVCRKCTSRILERHGCRVDIVEDGLKAVEALLANRYALAFIDGQMPGLDGLEVARAVRRQEPPGRHTLLIALTAHVLDAVREECLAAGMDDFVGKPVTADDLAAVLRKWLPACDQRPDELPAEDGAGGPVDADVLALALRDVADVQGFLRGVGLRLTRLVMDAVVAIAKGDAVSIEHVARTLHTEATAIGATQLATIAQVLEACGRARDAVQALQQLTPLQQTWRSTQDALEAGGSGREAALNAAGDRCI